MYQLFWITEHLATGPAPMSYEDLDWIREQGIRAIVNLCGEFCDLHTIEETSGFDVCYIPVPDECAPDLATLDRALDWLDEAIYLGKKVLVHCRMGHGRTGTFIAAYLLRRGFDRKDAAKAMKGRNAVPATFAQHRFLKKFGRKEGPLQTAAPRIENRPAVTGFDQLVGDYQALLPRFDALAGEGAAPGHGEADSPCCRQPFDLFLIESMHLSQAMNSSLSQAQRRIVIDRALHLAAHLQALRHDWPGLGNDALATLSPALSCPLLEEGQCLLFADRPPRCRYRKSFRDHPEYAALREEIVQLSGQAMQLLSGQEMPGDALRFSVADTLSGKFVQFFFQAMTRQVAREKRAGARASPDAG